MGYILLFIFKPFEFDYQIYKLRMEFFKKTSLKGDYGWNQFF
jgi:hypothetical protein